MKLKGKSFEELSVEEVYRYNSIAQKKRGLKIFDYFTFFEFGMENDIVMSHKHLLEWDKESYIFQKEHETMVRDNYDCLYMPGDFFRALPISEFSDGKKRELVYGMVISAQAYVFEKVINKLENVIDLRFPSFFGKPYGESMFKDIPGKKGYSTLDLSDKRSAGNEVHRKVLDTVLMAYRPLIEESIIKALKPYSGYTFRYIDDLPQNDNFVKFIIGGKKIAKKMTFRTFFIDFFKYQQPVGYLEQVIDKVFNEYCGKLED